MSATGESSELREALRLYGLALDEIYALRTLLACEARIAEAHGEFKTFPKSRRQILNESVSAMRTAARGRVRDLDWIHRYRHGRGELRAVSGSPLLTRAMWETETTR